MHSQQCFFPAATQAVPAAVTVAPRAVPIFFAVSPSLLSFPSASLPVSSVFLTESEKSLASSPASSKLLAAFSEAVLLELRSRALCRSEPPARCSAVFAGFGCGGRSYQRTRRHWQGQNRAFRFSVSVGCDFLVQNLISRCERLGGFVVLVELVIYRFHFRTENLERIVYLGEGFLELLFAFKTYFKTEIVRHSVSPPLNGHKKRALRLGGYRKRSNYGGCSFCVLNCSINGNLLIYTFDDWLNAFFICPVAFMIPCCHQCFFPYFVISWIFLCN